MKAVILAAGSGWRLRTVTPDRPNCLLEIGGRSLLSWSLARLEAMGIGQLVLVVGFAQQEIRRAVAHDPYRGDVTWVVNERFDLGNMYSLWSARSEMSDDLLPTDADVLYCTAILERLLDSPWPTAVLMDETVTPAGAMQSSFIAHSNHCRTISMARGSRVSSPTNAPLRFRAPCSSAPTRNLSSVSGWAQRRMFPPLDGE